MSLLRGLCRTEIVHFGARVERVETSEAYAEVLLADGSRCPCDAVVAADGIRSPFASSSWVQDEPLFSGTVVYRGLAEKDDVRELAPGPVNRYWLGPSATRLRTGSRLGSFLAVNAAIREADWARESWTDEAAPDEVLPAFAGWHEPLLERFAAVGCSFAAPFSFDGRWSTGPSAAITLLGDAAHAMEPFQAQGAAQAIEDAFVLGECLVKTSGVTAEPALGSLRGGAEAAGRGHAGLLPRRGERASIYLTETAAQRDESYGPARHVSVGSSPADLGTRRPQRRARVALG